MLALCLINQHSTYWIKATSKLNIAPLKVIQREPVNSVNSAKKFRLGGGRLLEEEVPLRQIFGHIVLPQSIF